MIFEACGSDDILWESWGWWASRAVFWNIVDGVEEAFKCWFGADLKYKAGCAVVGNFSYGQYEMNCVSGRYVGKKKNCRHRNRVGYPQKVHASNVEISFDISFNRTNMYIVITEILLTLKSDFNPFTHLKNCPQK